MKNPFARFYLRYARFAKSAARKLAASLAMTLCVLAVVCPPLAGGCSPRGCDVLCARADGKSGPVGAVLSAEGARMCVVVIEYRDGAAVSHTAEYLFCDSGSAARAYCTAARRYGGELVTLNALYVKIEFARSPLDGFSAEQAAALLESVGYRAQILRYASKVEMK